MSNDQTKQLLWLQRGEALGRWLSGVISKAKTAWTRFRLHHKASAGHGYRTHRPHR